MNEQIKLYIDTIPAVAQAAEGHETFWLNPGLKVDGEKAVTAVTIQQMEDARARLVRFAPLLPCGIGGAPGGVTYGLKQAFGNAVHCFFTEPTKACCMLLGMSLGMATGAHDGVSVGDFGIDGKTDADGLAVGRPSAFVGRVVEPLLSGICTIEDYRLYDLMRMLLDSEQIFIEPSAYAAFAALLHPNELDGYIRAKGAGCQSNYSHPMGDRRQHGATGDG